MFKVYLTASDLHNLVKVKLQDGKIDFFLKVTLRYDEIELSFQPDIIVS